MSSPAETPRVDVLIPTCGRPVALALSLLALASQHFRNFRIIVSDQTPGEDVVKAGEVAAVLRLLSAQGFDVRVLKHLPTRGMAEQRQFLLDQSAAPYVLYIDDDVILEPDLMGRLLTAIEEEGCGFVGSAVVGLSYRDDVRPHQQSIEFWEGPVRPERITWQGPGWERHALHNAANLYHVAQKLGVSPEHQRKYKVAWCGGCVMYDRAKLLGVGGFSFWRELPAIHCGEDVLAQFRVMAHFGGCGLVPSGAYHMELPTTLTDRRVNAPEVLPAMVPLLEEFPV